MKNEKLNEENKAMKKIRETTKLIEEQIKEDAVVESAEKPSGTEGKNKVKENEKEVSVGNPSLIKCTDCSFIAPNKRIMKGHMTSHSAKISKAVKCGVCDKRFQNVETLNVHWQNNSECTLSPEKHKCPKCIFEAESKSILDQHVKLNHKSEESTFFDFDNKQSVCRYWLKGMCTWTNCRYAHEKPSTKPTLEESNKSLKSCVYFEKGYCRYGERCKYKHKSHTESFENDRYSPKQRMETPRICFNQLDCRFFPNCRFQHFAPFLIQGQRNNPPPLDSMQHFPPLLNQLLQNKY